MTYSHFYPLRPNVTLTPWHELSLGWLITHEESTSPVSGNYPAANRAFYIPFRLDAADTFVKLFVANGATASGNIDVGVYSESGTRLLSTGSTAQSGTNTLQLFDITDTAFGPGYFYMAIAMDNTTGTVMQSQPGGAARANSIATWGVKQEASAFPLPATATFANGNALFMPLFGLSLVTDL